MTREFAAALDKHIEAHERGYQAWLARAVGCSEPYLTRLKTGQVKSSEFLEAVSEITGIELPPLAMDPDLYELLEIAQAANPDKRKLLVEIAKSVVMGALGDPTDPD